MKNNRRRKMVFAAGIILVLLSGCAKQVTDKSESETSENYSDLQDTKADETAISPEVILEIQEKQLITDFYEAIYGLNSDINKTIQYSLSGTVEKYKKPILAFINYETSEDSPYHVYIKEIQSMQQTEDLMTGFINAEPLEKWDDEIYKIPYVFMVDWFTADIMSVELPFEYEGQTLTQANNDSEDFIQYGKDYLSYMNKRIDGGGNIYCDMPSYAADTYQYSFLNKTTYNTDKGDVLFSPDIFYNGNTGMFEFSFNLEFVNNNYDVSSIAINDVIINSTKIKSYFQGDWVVARIYAENRDDSMNTSYNEIVEEMKENEITVTINGESNFVLSDEDKQQLEGYLLDFNTLQYIVKNSVGTSN